MLVGSIADTSRYYEDDMHALDNTFTDDKYHRLRVLPASFYGRIDPVHLRLWAHKRAIYQFLTSELLDWLRSRIGDYKAIEIGAGNNDLGYHLGIPRSDNYCQTDSRSFPGVEAAIARLGQSSTKPRGDVERLDAIEAILKYRPDIVIASWLTQHAYEHEEPGHGSMYGPEEEEILSRVREYIFIGNLAAHGDKRIMKHPHKTYKRSWLVSRAGQPDKNCIIVWRGRA